ncbi:MAG: hypothetical protein ACXWN0_01185 [Isosphaeraceae bacterium]
METAREIVVRPTEVDVNGHVNNTKYVENMEWGARGTIRAPGASPRPAVGARGPDRDGESEVKGGRKSMLDDPSPARTASRQTSGDRISGASAFDLIELWKSSSRFHRVRPGPRCTGHRGLEDLHGRTTESSSAFVSLTQADGCQPASAQSSPLTAELQIMK